MNMRHEHELPRPARRYTGDRPPHPSSHVVLDCVGSELMMMPSLRRPKRVTLHGSDQRDARFLVKGGEDLRQDQRVQLMFRSMNGVLAASPQCAARGLSMRTYAVVPLNDSVGVIEWMDGTRPLKGMIEQRFHSLRGCRGKCECQATAGNKYAEFYNQRGRSLYLDKLNVPAGAIKTMLEASQAYWPDDCLSRGVAALSHSAETYLAMRGCFCRSLGALTVSSYLLGIGDRHLDNFMLEDGTGRVVGIDFGHAFGSATYQLPVPELVGVRLTRQMTSFLKPLDSSVLLRTHMVLALKALRARGDELMRVMEVFVSEPLLDWESHARKLSAEQKRALEESSSAELASASLAGPLPGSTFPDPTGGAGDLLGNFARSKLAWARDKLGGGNPARITIKEVEMSSVPAVQKKQDLIREIVLGPAGSKRRAMPAVGLDVEDQVDCLIEQATDPNILGRMWQGWAPWL